MADEVPVTKLETLRKSLRDLLIFLAIVFLILDPAVVGRFVKDAKLEFTYDTERHELTVKAQEETLDLADRVSHLSLLAQTLKSSIQTAAASPSHPDLAALTNAASELVDGTNRASTAAVNTLATQQQVAQDLNAVPTVEDGWVYLGKVADAAGNTWVGQPHVKAESPVGLVGQTVTVVGNSFLHKDVGIPANTPNRGWRAAQQVVGVVKDRDSIRIDKTEIDDATDGGYALWALIRRQK